MEHTRTISLAFDVGSRVDLRLENRSGPVSIRGEEVRQVRVEVVARLWAESDAEADEQAQEIVRGMLHEGNRVTIRAPTLAWPGPFLFGRGPRIEYRVSLPRTSVANVTSRSGRIEVEDLAGPVQVEAHSGSVNLRRIGASAAVTSHSGSVQAEAIGGSLTIDSRSGGVQVRRCGGDLTVHSRSGSLRIEEVGGSLKAECRSGSFAIAGVGGGLTVRARSGSLRYEGPVRGPFDIEARSGSIVLAVDRESRFFLDAETAHGSIRSDLPVRRGPPGRTASGETGHRVRIRTRSGSIRITQS